jgi:hypothetical protein
MKWRCRIRAVQVLRCCRNTVWPWPQSPLLVVAAVRTMRPQVTRIRPDVRKSRSSRVRQTKFNEKHPRRTKPVATCVVSLARLKQNSTYGMGELCTCTNRLVRCVTKRLVPTDARRLARALRTTHARRGRGIILYCSIDVRLDAYHLEILKAPSSDETSGRNVYSVSCFDVATG